MPQLNDDQVRVLARGLHHKIQADAVAGSDLTRTLRVLDVVSARERRGLSIGLTEREAAVLIAAAAGEPVPPHPYREQWQLDIMLARKDSACPFCPESIHAGVEIARWPLTAQWGHRACVEAKAVAEPPTKESRRKSIAILMSMSRKPASS
ncbi:hypothetical protein [Kribbella solani]|uniref:Uncharacterized protein n=1 Tax=Kribbella solani TaxID=236067 RepID=A0A841E4N5_9ACTN|nr:hypothetical protein [Kribbella solani]MBB5984016.1 hypothetical protein [Kribbella solani]